MSLIFLYQLEQKYYPKFIEALLLDMRTSNYGGTVEDQTLGVAISLLEEPGKYTDLSLEKIIIGTLNMAITLQSSKYGNITPQTVGEDIYNKFTGESNYWFVGYNMALRNNKELSPQDALKFAIPVIERAAKGRFYITPCFPNTLNLFFEYCMELDPHFVPPQIPTGDTFGKWTPEQFLVWNTNYSSSLLSQSLFAVKKYKLDPANLPQELSNELNHLIAMDREDNGDNEEERTNRATSCCMII
ncbi:hypothetical protein OQJ18_07015 [Fluoribacter dumoffii]|uniref:hypothetical protein n=1 Tax=Fluoribacter dumoffii TaxID=463 RepID=UPI00026C786D|nr:hypothetical protein [Fluoribacter dumoffii]MCW8385101.1 hypothetical protein [Fluoribacter dumoffii]MCW8418157.1 hypothetical protein [Fluoribacter dumoffii]MCW8454001.1 hypothetical protein [Fluoribacter dumoffii]MCW8461928.1 hypothetical protein [Fluoribacter dumoffii]MCW8482140.1 hypothetical protein [Fluoribacter dumoffii]